jgi:hypothetical protein
MASHHTVQQEEEEINVEDIDVCQTLMRVYRNGNELIQSDSASATR